MSEVTVLHDAILASLLFWSERYVEHVADGNHQQAMVVLMIYRSLLVWVEISTDDQTN